MQERTGKRLPLLCSKVCHFCGGCRKGIHPVGLKEDRVQQHKNVIVLQHDLRLQQPPGVAVRPAAHCLADVRRSKIQGVAFGVKLLCSPLRKAVIKVHTLAHPQGIGQIHAAALFLLMQRALQELHIRSQSLRILRPQ